MKDYLSLIDTETQGNRCDVTPLFGDHAAFNALVDDLVALVQSEPIDIVACIDALGFILGTAIAQRLEVGILPVRKGGKLPVSKDVVVFEDYSRQEKRLEIRQDMLSEGMHVLIVDEWIETGTQVSAAIELTEAREAIVSGVAAINIDVNEKTKRLMSQCKVFTVWQDMERPHDR